MQKSLGPKSTARRRLGVLSGYKARARPLPNSLFRNPPPRTPAAADGPAAGTPAAAADAALDRLLLARSDLAGIVSQVDTPLEP